MDWRSAEKLAFLVVSSWLLAVSLASSLVLLSEAWSMLCGAACTKMTRELLTVREILVRLSHDRMHGKGPRRACMCTFSVDRCHAWLMMLDRTEMYMMQVSDCMRHVKSSGYMQSSKA